jgi:hypothetical protein
MGRTKFFELREEVEARPGAKDRLAARRTETLKELDLANCGTPRPSVESNPRGASK